MRRQSLHYNELVAKGHMLSIDQFRDEFNNRTFGWDWEVEGFLDKRGYVHPIDTDTKVISTVFERLVSPVLRSIAKTYGYVVEIANQTTYPDFTMTLIQNGASVHRVALDIKTTYASNSMLFTLGGYNSFLRSETKNILHPYSTYSDHWIIGFVYKQNPAFNEYDLEKLPARGEIDCPYTNVVCFVREKAAISGIRAGSGNTKNIGSVKARGAAEFASVSGPFMRFREYKLACDHYWRNYEKYSIEIFTEVQLLAHPDFQKYK